MARRRSRRRKREQAPGWIWMAAGLVLGVAIAVGVYRIGGDGAGRAAAPASSAASRQTAPPPQPDTPPPASAQPAAAEPPPSRFDFYDILPQFEVVIPEVETPPPPSRTDRQPAAVAVADPGNYVLQAGSFRSHADADRMQASLALLGIESRIQTVTIDQDVFHRVRIGPMSDLDELNRIRRQLNDARVDVLMMRVQ